MTLFKRIEGLFFNPKPVFDSLAEKPAWIDAMVVLLVLLVAFSVLVNPFLQKDQLQLMKDNVRFKERVGEERYNQMIESMENPSPARKIIQNFVSPPVFFIITLLLQTLILLIICRFASTQGNFKQLFSAFVHANFIDKLLGNAVRLVLALTKKSVIQTSTGLALFFPRLEITSPAYIILASVDFFQLWLFGVLAYGISSSFKIDIRKALFISYGFWILKTAVNIVIALFSTSFVR